MTSHEHREESESSNEVVPVYSLPGEIQGLIADQSVLQTETLVDLSLPENLETPTIASVWPFVYRTYFRFNTFLVPCVDKEDAKVTLRKWIWEKLDARMLEELARPSIGPHLIVELAIIADRMPHGPLYPMAHQVDVRIKADPDTVSSLFELARRFRSLEAIKIRYVLVARREEQLINGEWKIRRIDEAEADGAEWRIRDTKLSMPEPIEGTFHWVSGRFITRELFRLLETANGVPTEEALTLSYSYLPSNSPTWFWTTQIPTSPEVIKMYEDIARDPAMRIPHALPYVQKSFFRITADIIHYGDIFGSNYDDLVHASNFCTCHPVEDR